MKKLLIAVLTVLTFSTTAFATDANKVNQRVLNNFKQNFEDASEVEWSVKSAFTKATFTQGKKRCTAFYDQQGELFASSYGIELGRFTNQCKKGFCKKICRLHC